MGDIKIIDRMTFNTSKAIKIIFEENANSIRLETANQKINLKRQLKDKIKEIKKSNSDHKKAEILKQKQQTKLMISQIEEAAKVKAEGLKIKVNENYSEILLDEKKNVKKSENKLEKSERKHKIKDLKMLQKKMILEQKLLLKQYTQSNEEYRIVKNNIKNIKFNTAGKISELNKNVLFSPLITLFKKILRVIIDTGFWFRKVWRIFKSDHPNTAQFLVFFMISNGITVLQLALMPIIKLILNETDLVNVSFQIGQVGKNFNGTPYYMFDYVSGPIKDGIGGGLAYFLSVQITLAIAQIINFFSQRSITFKSDSNPWIAAIWYFLAYITITFIAAAAQGLYKAPIYNLFMNTWNLGSTGELFADFITMIINSAISFWVFFPIFKIIFKKKEESAR